MRLTRLGFPAYGHFTDKELEFPAEGPGLSIIIGRNGTGKTTARRGFESGLFGVPHNTPDAHLHAGSAIRIEAELVRADGATLTFARRKGRVGTLASLDGSALDDAELDAFLGGSPRDLYLQMFSFSRGDLQAGGRDLLAGRGALGESLFGAALGLGHVHALIAELEDEAHDLFAKGAQNPVLNRLLRQYQDERAEVQRLSLRPDDYVNAQQEAAENRARRVEIQNRLAELRREAEDLRTFDAAIPLLERRAELCSQLEELKDVPRLAEDAPERRRRAVEARERARKARQTADKAIEGLEAELLQVSVSPELIAEEAAISDLHAESGAYAQGQRDRTRIEGQVEGFRRQAARELERWRPGADVAEPDAWRLPGTAAATLEDLGDRSSALEATLSSAREQEDDSRALIESRRAQLDHTADPVKLGALADAVDELGRSSDAAGDVVAAENEVASAEARVAEQLRALEGFDGTVEDLRTMRVPSTEQLEHAARRVETIDAEIELERDKKQTASEERDDLDIEIADLEGALPVTLDALSGARSARDDDFEALVSGWADGASPEPTKYRESVVHADQIADHLRDNSERSARHAGAVARRGALDRRVERAESRMRELEEDRVRALEAWSSEWSGLETEPGEPALMRTWLSDRRDILGRASDAEAERRELARKRSRTERATQTLRRALADLGEAVPAESADDVVAAHGRNVLERLRSDAEADRVRRQSIADLEVQLANAGRRVDAAQRSVDEWGDEWVAALRSAGLDPDMKPAECAALLDGLNSVDSVLADIERLEHRSKGIDEVAALFTEQVETLAGRLAVPTTDGDPVATLSELRRRLRNAQDAAAEASRIQERIDTQCELRDGADEQLNDAEAELSALLAAARVAEVAELEAAERESAEAKAAEAALQSVDAGLADLSPKSCDQLTASIGGRTRAELAAELGLAEDEEAELGAEHETLAERHGELKRELAEWGGDGDAAEANERAQQLLEEARAAADRWATLKAAIALLREQIRAHCEEHKGPILERASTLFVRLAGDDAFRGLEIGFEKGEPVIVGVRPDGTRVGVGGMSEGQADQLYFALRIASLERHFEKAEPMPLILDDTLLAFDDEGAGAAFEVLAELGAKAQILFFTHHEHLVELAKQRLSQDQFSLQRLERPKRERHLKAA